MHRSCMSCWPTRTAGCMHVHCISWKYCVTSKIKLHQLTRICLKYNRAKFHPDPIWNNGALVKWDQFLAHDSICWARYMLSPVCPSVRLSHQWISRKRLKLGSCNFHHTVAPSLCFLWYKFHPEIPTGSPPSGGVKQCGVAGNELFS